MRGIPFDVNDTDLRAVLLGRLLAESLARLRPADPPRWVHPVFGPLGVEEWSRSHFKHGYHHLLQFGLLEPTSADVPAGRAERSRGD